MTPLRVSRRELIRWAAAASVLSGVPLVGCKGPEPIIPDPWKPAFFSAAEVETLEALADTVIAPEADGTGGGKALGAAVFVDRLLTALDGAPKLHAEGPFSGREPFADSMGKASTNFPADAFNTFAPLDRVNEAAWKLKLFGSSALAGGAPNEALLGAVSGLRADVRAMLGHARTLAGDLPSRVLAERVRVLEQLTEDERDLCLELVCQAAFSAPEYGGNRAGAGWKQISFEGDSQPLGYSIWDETNNVYRERPEAPMSTANPGVDPDPLDKSSTDLIETVVLALGGRIAS